MRNVIERSFVPDMLEVEGRTLVLRLVPYGKPTMVRDVVNGVLGRPYREGFQQGAFTEAIANDVVNRGRVALNVTHVQLPMNDVGRAIRLEEDAAGAIGTFVVDESPFGDHALAKVISRQWRGVSVSATVRASQIVDEIVWRTKVHPRHAALTEQPAYADAEVLAVRSMTPLMDTWLDKYRIPAQDQRNRTPAANR